jgi:U3 small nucleolar RNA-associated protein 18
MPIINSSRLTCSWSAHLKSCRNWTLAHQHMVCAPTPAIIFVGELTFRDHDAPPSSLHARVATMAPVATVPHKANNHQRYMPENSSNATKQAPDFTLEESDTDTGALQPVNEPQEPEWEGFGGEEETKDSEDEDEEGRDADSTQIDVSAQKQGKIMLPKDAEEEELERMIFGDSAGFKQGLEDFSLDRTSATYGDLSDADEDEEADIEAVPDQDLFFFDAGPVPAPGSSSAVAKADETEDEDDKPAWDDSDDERLVVSLASVPQLRKLRETVDDDMVNGKEYSRRLRRQYERLYPAPEWALHANKKRRRAMDDDDSGEGSGSDMDMDEENLTLQPLAKLLHDADILSRNARGPMKKRKLQAGTVDIQRLKDVMKAGPVSTLLHRIWIYVLTLSLVCGDLALLPSHVPATSLLRP